MSRTLRRRVVRRRRTLEQRLSDAYHDARCAAVDLATAQRRLSQAHAAIDRIAGSAVAASMRPARTPAERRRCLDAIAALIPRMRPGSVPVA